MHGHNGFLTALLLGGGLILLERKPFLAGLLLGCLVYKPQFALVLPLLLLALWNWRAIAGAAVSSLALISDYAGDLGLAGLAGVPRQLDAHPEQS